MSLKNKTKLVLLSIAAVTSLLMGNVFQVYAASSQQPTLVVFVNVINDDGGVMKASDFAITVTAKSPSPAIFSGSETGTTVTMKNSAYNVTELAVKGYNVSYSPGCSGRINNNEAKTCVITNDDIAPHLKVIKHVINDNGGTSIASDFTMSIYGNNPSQWSFPGSENGTDVKFGPGYYSVYENWNQDYISSYSPECSGQINLGETKTCTITNDDRPKAQITVIKKVINDNDGTAIPSDFTLYVSSSYKWQSFLGSETGTNVTVYEGNYYVGEYTRGDYSNSYSGDCSGYIKGGEIKTCTITNNDKPKAQITVIKKVINDNGGTAIPSDFTLYVSSDKWQSFPGSGTGTNVTVYEGYYYVGEDYRWDYSQTNSGDCSGYIKGGEIKTCTVTNNDKII